MREDRNSNDSICDLLKVLCGSVKFSLKTL